MNYLKATHKVLKTVVVAQDNFDAMSPRIAGQAFEHWKETAAYELGCNVEDLIFEHIKQRGGYNAERE